MNRKAFAIGIILSIFSTVGYAQKGVEDGSKYGHGEDSVRCLTNLSLYKEYVDQKNYKDATGPWEIVFNECPSSTKNIYTHGVKIYEWKIKNSATPEEKQANIEMLMKIYDQRIKYFGKDRRYPASYVEGKKGAAIIKYYVNDLPKYKEGYALIEKSVKDRGPKTSLTIIQKYLFTTVLLYKKGEIQGDQVVNAYTLTSDILDQQIKASTSEKKTLGLEKVKNALDEAFVKSGSADCQTIVSVFGPQLETEKTNKEWLNKILKLMRKAGCTEDDFYYSAAEALHVIEPTAESAYALAKMYLRDQDYAKAMPYYQEAVKLEEDEGDKADYYFQMSFITFSNLKNYSKARALARKAIDVRPNWGAPYILIGKMYAASAQGQQLGSKDLENRAGYWAAVDMFHKAASVDADVKEEARTLVNVYSKHFPDAQELFFNEITEGSKITVGGWIQVSTKARPKK